MFGAVPLPLRAKAGIAYEFLKRLRESLTTSTKYAETVLAVLDLLASRPAVHWMLTLRANEITIDPTLDHELRLYLQIWLHKR